MTKELLVLIYTEACGPMTIRVLCEYTYFITFTNAHSRYGYVYLIKHKSESFERFKKFRNEVEKILKRVSKYFNMIEVVNTWTKYFKII